MPVRSKSIPATLTFRIDPKIRKQLSKLADDRHMSEGSLVALLVEEGLKRGGSHETRLRNVEHEVNELQLWMSTVRAMIGLPDQPATQHVATTDPDRGNQHEPDRPE